MSRTTVLPHLQTTNVEVSPWTVSIRNQVVTTELVAGWDYQTPLDAVCVIRADPATIQEDCRLHSEDRLAVIAIWQSNTTGVRQKASFVELSDANPVRVEFSVPPSRIGGVLRFSRQLVLVGNGKSRDPLAAVRPGSILWQEDRRNSKALILEGEAARFPTEVIDFSVAPIGETQAAWWLNVSMDDLDVSPLQALRLYVNGEHPMMKRVLAGGDDDTTRMVRSVLEWDVARSMVRHALDNDDFIDGFGAFLADSVGEMVEFLLLRYWPGSDARSLRATRNDNPGRFEYQLQARFGLMDSNQ